MKHPIYLIAAADEKNGIGKSGKLPWSLKKDMAFFHHQTEHTEHPAKLNMVIMGRTTWESIPDKFRPLKGRKNVVLTHRINYKATGADIYESLEQAIHDADDTIESIYIIGGAKVYENAIQFKELTGIYLTKIAAIFDCDAFMPKIPAKFKKVTSLGEETENGIRYQFLLYTK